MKQDSMLTPLFKTIDRVVFGFQDLEDSEKIKKIDQNKDIDEEEAEEKVIVRSIN